MTGKAPGRFVSRQLGQGRTMGVVCGSVAACWNVLATAVPVVWKGEVKAGVAPGRPIEAARFACDERLDT